MKQWTKEIVINAPIEVVWKLFDGSFANMQKIMPQVVEHKPVKITEEGVGSVFRQKYKEGNRIEEYDIKTLEFLDDENNKKLKVGFTLANMFEITALYELIQMNNKTLFRYTVTNRPLKWFVKLLLLFANEKVVIQFVERVKRVAESGDQ
ncbi:SRPBCC family protein [Ammoniphilus sp. 3BR4]|uniref:SRPBCC family protein n=1 Tax=Ammoniphilus sp. 3BR4 TaxID=3158265 RepID=UPI003465F11A